MQSGIYKITNKVTGDFYIGSSSRLSTRKGEHVLSARAGRHHSIIFQRAWDKYGEKAFEFKIIESCNINNLLEREQYYIDKFNPKYNIAKVAGKPNPPDNKPILRTCMVSGHEKVYQTRDEAELEGFNGGEITACCLGRAGSHKGFFWSFVNDNEQKIFVNKKRTKPVKRIEPETLEEKLYSSMTMAAKKNNCHISGISECCLGKSKTYKGYWWAFANVENKPKPKLIKPKDYGEFPSKVTNNDIIVKINPNTNEREEFPSITMIDFQIYNRAHIIECCLGKRNFHQNMIWRVKGFDDIDCSKIKKRKFGHKIKRIDPKSLEEKLYPNINSVKVDGFNVANVNMCCNGKRGSHKGYLWEYANKPVAFKSKIKRVEGTNLTTGEKKLYKNKSATKVDGFSPAKVGACCLGRRKTHKNYTWKEIDD